MYKSIEEYPNYRINNFGQVQSNFKFKTNIPCDVWRDVKQIYDKSCGYMIVTLCSGNGKRQNKRVHRLLMEAFVPNPNQCKHINHIDADKLNNSLSNLEWVTPKQNASHAAKLGLYQPSIDATSVAVLQYSKNGEYLNEYSSLHEAGRQTNTAWQNIYKVCKGKRNTAGNYIWKYK